MRGVIRWQLKLRTGSYEIVVFRANSLRNVVGWPGSVECPFETVWQIRKVRLKYSLNIQMYGVGHEVGLTR